MRNDSSIATKVASVALALTILQAAKADDAASPCQAGGWDMTRETKAFSGTALSMDAGGATLNLPVLRADTLYVLKLRPQSDVHFVQAPGKATTAPLPMAGLVQFKVMAVGRYRVTVDTTLWIDAISPAGMVRASAFNGWHGCASYAKSVDYVLQAGQSVVLQFSGASTDTAKVTIEPLPAI